MEKSCDNCTYKLKKNIKSKYNNPKVRCIKRNCMVSKASEAQWCELYNEIRSEVLKTS